MNYNYEPTVIFLLLVGVILWESYQSHVVRNWWRSTQIHMWLVPRIVNLIDLIFEPIVDWLTGEKDDDGS